MVESVLPHLPTKIGGLIARLPVQLRAEMEEIRFRIDRPVEISASGKPHFLEYVFTKGDAEQLISKLANHSLYTLDEELRMGYVTIAGGHRVGLAGKVILEEGKVKAIRHLASFNIRIAREKIGIADAYIPILYDQGWKNTMIIGGPQTGKTTLLRDLARVISTGGESIPALKTGIVDERSEIAGCVSGVPTLSFGPRIDVLDGCPKAEGMMMMIRSMSPDVLIVDEIGREEDSVAIMEAVNAGVSLMMTTHGKDLNDIVKRPLLKKILDQQVFERCVVLSRENGPGTAVSVTDAQGRKLRPSERAFYHA